MSQEWVQISPLKVRLYTKEYLTATMCDILPVTIIFYIPRPRAQITDPWRIQVKQTYLFETNSASMVVSGSPKRW